jgi:site-specific DNA-methyltransferase (adenine-specific)
MTHQLHCGNNAEVLKQYPDSYFDSIITDPPYGIEFLGKDWDNHTGTQETWRECLRVLKPGGHLLAFSAARTYHNLATNIESVGFEIRDQLMWIYSSGFPKAQDIGKSIDKRGQKNNWHGWKTALKPGHEPIVMARKPMKGSTIDNVLQHGVGALNIDVSRIPYEDQADLNTYINNIAGPLERSTATAGEGIGMHEGRTGFKVQRGRVKRPQAGNRTASFSFGDKDTESGGDGSPEFEANPQGRYPSNVMGDIPHYQKYFYCPKVSRRERHAGFEQSGIPNTVKMLEQMGGYYCDKNGNKTTSDQHTNLAYIPNIGVIQSHGVSNEYGKWCKKKEDPLAHIPIINQGNTGKNGANIVSPTGEMNHSRASELAVGNNHPTVKPVALMRYLIQLVTPANSRVLDPFMGSGSTGMAAVELGHRFVGIDLDANYVSIADRRIQGWCAKNPIETKTKTESPMVAVTKPHSAFDRLFE